MIPDSFLHSEIRLRLLLHFSSPRPGAVYIFVVFTLAEGLGSFPPYVAVQLCILRYL